MNISVDHTIFASVLAASFVEQDRSNQQAEAALTGHAETTEDCASLRLSATTASLQQAPDFAQCCSCQQIVVNARLSALPFGFWHVQSAVFLTRGPGSIWAVAEPLLVPSALVMANPTQVWCPDIFFCCSCLAQQYQGHMQKLDEVSWLQGYKTAVCVTWQVNMRLLSCTCS